MGVGFACSFGNLWHGDQEHLGAMETGELTVLGSRDKPQGCTIVLW